MKFRIGFVSNSSSSSFIVAVKGGTLKQVLEQLKIKNHPFSSIINDVINAITENSEATTLKKLIDDMGFDSEEDFAEEFGKDILKFESNGFKLYQGFFSNEGETGAEIMLCDTDLNYKSDDLIIIHEGGY